MKYIAIALAIALAACATGPKPAVIVRHDIIVANLDPELVQQCVNRIHRSDVPTVQPGHTRPLESDTDTYIRKLEDAYAICEQVVREGEADGRSH